MARRVLRSRLGNGQPRAAALAPAPAAVPPSTSTVMNQWPRRVALCCVRWSFIYFGVSTATKSHLPVILTTSSQRTNWAFSYRFQLQFGNEEEEVEERRIAFTTDPLSPPSLSSSCQLTVSHSLKMTSHHERHRGSRRRPPGRPRPTIPLHLGPLRREISSRVTI